MSSVHSRSSFGWLIVAVVALLCVAAEAQQEVPDFYPDSWYLIAVNADGEMVESDGHGYNDGTWYYYPDTGWYRQWFYNDPYDPDRMGQLLYKAYITPGPSAGSTDIEMQFNWSTPEWSALGLGRPPLPGDVPNSSAESQYIDSENFHTTSGISGFQSVEPNRELTIEEYNPEWTCIAIRGKNFRVYRWAMHHCVPKDGTQEGAWCNRGTGDCYIGTADEGRESYTWLGAGSSCSSCEINSSIPLDFGDAPDPSFPTLLNRDGARHTIVDGVFLGEGVSSETNGKPNPTATGDDDDGVVFLSAIEPGKIASLNVTASVQGYLNAWIDFDGNGSFGGADEQIFSDEVLTPGVNTLAFAVPEDAVQGPTFARFRFNTRGLLTFDGPASDGEVEDYAVAIHAGFGPQPVSGLTRAQWNQPPTLLDPADLYHFDGSTVLSALGLQRIVADDCQFEDNQPITGIHWWGSFDGWTQPSMPAEQPLAFHIAVWSDVPDMEPGNPTTFNHPGTLLWETYALNWTWAVAGQQQTGQTCFEFSHMLSQDQWFYPTSVAAGASPEATFLWVSIAAVYDIADVQYPWGWMSRTHGSSAPATIIQEIIPVDLSPWPPVPGAHWYQGTLVHDGNKQPLDMAFQLTTYQSPFGAGSGTDGKSDK